MQTFRTTDDVTLAYTDEGQGRPVVLVHGYTAPAASWALTVDALVDAGYRAIAFDRRAHGESETPAHGQRMARHGRDLGELLAHLDLEDAVVVGASMGGNTFWAYVDQFGPARLRGAVIVDQTPKMLNADGWEHGFYGYDATNAGTLFAAGVPDTGRGRTVDRSPTAMTRLVERLGGPPAFRDPSAPETLPLLADHARQDWRDVVRRFPLPLLMLAGRDSQIWPCEHAAAAVADTARGRALVIEDAGHAISFDQPDRFNEALLAFLADVDADAPPAGDPGRETAGAR
jgi:pimeloyl-ACP methyl ester carboxylesterase